MTFTIAWLGLEEPADIALAEQSLANGARLVAAASRDEAGIAAALAVADALVVRDALVEARLLASAPGVRFVQKVGRREDGIDLDAAEAAGVTLAVMPLRGCIAVAELAFTLVLALSKQIVRAHAATVGGAYRDLGLEPQRTSQQSHAFQWMRLPVFEVAGTTLGIVGYGEIGTEVSLRARAFGMKVLYTKRTRLPRAIEARYGVEWADLDDLIARSDFVLLATPQTPDTEGLIGKEELARMRPHAFLVNVCRGAVVDEAALVDALSSGAIAGAGLDVLVEEPVPADHPLLRLPNVILTPHIGGGSGGAREKHVQDILENVMRFVRGQTPLHILESR